MTQMPPPVPPPFYQQPPYQPAESKRIAAGVCAILVGSLGVHKFILGYTAAGIVMCESCVKGPAHARRWRIGIVMHIIGLIEGITYLTKSDAEFYQTYVANRKPWF